MSNVSTLLDSEPMLSGLANLCIRLMQLTASLVQSFEDNPEEFVLMDEDEEAQVVRNLGMLLCWDSFCVFVCSLGIVGDVALK